MENDAIGGNAARGATTGGADAGGAGGGDSNAQLSKAFDTAMEKAAKTLQITTEKGAELYALKQSVR